MATANGLGRRIEALEAIHAPCGACQERRRHIYFEDQLVPDRCEGCDRPIEAQVFTLRVDRATDPEGDAA